MQVCKLQPVKQILQYLHVLRQILAQNSHVLRYKILLSSFRRRVFVFFQELQVNLKRNLEKK